MIEASPDKPVKPLLFLCRYGNAVSLTNNNGKKTTSENSEVSSRAFWLLLCRLCSLSFSFASRMIEQYNSLMMLKGELTHCPV